MKSLAWYAFGQAISYGLDLGTFSLLVAVMHLGPPVLDNLIGKTLAATFAFFFHARFSFSGQKNKSRASSAIAYLAMLVSNMALTSCLLGLLIVLVHHQHVIAVKFLADIIGVLWTFVCMRIFVFPLAQKTSDMIKAR